MDVVSAPLKGFDKRQAFQVFVQAGRTVCQFRAQGGQQVGIEPVRHGRGPGHLAQVGGQAVEQAFGHQPLAFFVAGGGLQTGQEIEVAHDWPRNPSRYIATVEQCPLTIPQQPSKCCNSMFTPISLAYSSQ